MRAPRLRRHPDHRLYDARVRPFLLITTRPEDDVVRTEREAFLTFTGLAPEDLHWLRIEQEDPPVLRAEDWSGIFLAGSPFTTSDPAHEKSAAQNRAEAALATVLDQVIAQDIPFFGACYGVGTLGVHQGAVVDRTYGETVGAIPVTLTAEGKTDPLLQAAGMPDTFRGLVGHKEAIHTLPPHATLLASGENCPVQMFRVGTRQYATQFHPELDVPGIIERLGAYRGHGYVDPAEYDATVAKLRESDVPDTWKLLRGFATLFGG